MSDTPELTPPDQPPEPRRRRRVYRTLIKVGVGLGAVAATVGIVGAIWGDRIVTELLLPRVTASVDKAIKRPTELGEVTGFTFWGVKLGKTIIPPTDTDASSITVDEIEVTVGLRSLIFQQTLKSNIVLVRPQVLLVQGEDGKWTDFELPEPSETENRVKLEIQSIEVEDATVRAAPYVDPEALAIVPREPALIDETQVTLEFFGEEAKEISFELAGELDDGKFDIDGEANLDERAVKANARLQDLPATSVNLLLPNAFGIRSGELDGNLTAIAALTEDGTLDESVTDVKGTAQFANGEFVASTLPAPLTNIRSQLLFKGQKITLEDTGLQLNDNELTASGDVDIDEGYDITAQIPAISVAEVQALATLDLPIALDGTFQLDAQVTGELEQPQLRGQLASLQPVLVDKLLLDSVVADFGLTEYAEGIKIPSRFDLNELRVRPRAGGVVVARGQADLRDLENLDFQMTAEADVPVDAFAQIYGVSLPEDITAGQLVADIEAGGNLKSQTAFAQWQLSEGTFPGTGEVSLIDNLVVLENTRLQSEQGTLAAEAVLNLDNGDWQASANTQRVSVQQFAAQVSGLLDADVRASGNLNALDLQQIQASGTAFIADAQVRLNETTDSLIDRGDWTTAFEWQGDRIAVDYFTAPGVQANGTIGVDLSQPKLIDQLDLNVALQSFDLQPLNSFAPANVRQYAQLAGLTSFNGQLFGTLENPQIVGNARLNQLAVNDLLFEPLAGPVSFSLAQGGRLDLQGQQDRLQVALSDSPGGKIPYWPSSFAIQNQDFIANGYGSSSQLHAEVQLPLERLDIQPALQYGFGTVGGLLAASVDVNLADFSNPAANGTLKVTQPTLSPIDAEQITARFAYANSTATLEQGELLFDNSRYLLTGSANLADSIQYQGALTIAEGRIEDLVPIFEKLNLSAFGAGDPPTPYGSAADLATASVGVPAAPLPKKLESFMAFLRAHPPEQDGLGARSLPALEDLEGAFTGSVAVAGKSLALADATADFNLKGDSWQWGADTPPNKFALVGEVKQMGVDIETAFVDAGETQINLSGGGTLNQLDGNLKVENLPVELAELFYPLPARVIGDLDLAATFGGSLANPIVQGEATVENTEVNDYAIETVAANFNYRNAVLNLNSEVALDSAYAPVTIKGNVPYALPFMTVQPPTDRLAINAVIPNNGLEVINAFTDGQVLWQGGQGNVSVEVGGTLAQPAVVGLASFRDGTISSPQLGEDITGLTGDVRFNLERVDVEQLRANMGDGQLVVSGRLPLLPSGQPIFGDAFSSEVSQSAQGVVVSLEGLPVDYSDILQAVLKGQVLVTGAALAPTVSGNIEIDEGRVRATNLLAQAGSISLPTQEEVEAVSPYRVEYLGADALPSQPNNQPQGLLDQVMFQNFDVSFGDRLNILGQPFYNITALGGLSVSGPVSNLQPTGTIRLKSGWINLFSTQFRLDRDAPNTATFSPETGLSPLLDVVMTARVQEADITPAPTVAGGFANAEINESQVETLGNVEYIEVRAIAQGPVSDLQDNLILTSEPDRDQGELLALLGSNVVTGITSASYLQVGEFLGAGSLTNFGDRIADIVGLKSFSVTPTTDTGEAGSTSIGLEVAAAASLSKRFDVDFQQTLNSNRRPLLGTQYRLTDELKLRGASNLDEAEFELEYRIRF
ncbi:MAG: translocation/assembly module TamB domain-containing protein [Phormidesmis sp.]